MYILWKTYQLIPETEKRKEQFKEMTVMKQNSLWKKTIVAMIGAALLSIGLAGCGQEGANQQAKENQASSSSEDTSGKSDLKPFRLGVGGSEDSYTMFTGNVAYAKGYFEEELNKVGYTLELSSFGGGGPEINESLAAGQLDAAVYGDFPAFTSKSNGIDTTVIASVNGQQQFAVIVSDDTIKEPKDLEGKKVIVAQGTVTQFFWEHYVEERGIDESAVEILNATTDAQSLIATKDADAYIMIPSSLYYMESLGLGKVIDTGADIPEASTTYLMVAANSLLKESPDVAVAINKALIRAHDDIKKDQKVLYDATASSTITSDFSKKDFEFDTVLEALSPEISDDTLAHYNELNDWLVSHSVISEAVDVDSFVDRSYYEQAVKELEK